MTIIIVFHDLHKGDTDLTTIVISKWKCSTKVLKYQLYKTFNRSSYQLSLVRIQMEKASWQTAGMKRHILLLFCFHVYRIWPVSDLLKVPFHLVERCEDGGTVFPQMGGPHSKWIYLFSHLPYRWQNPLFNSFVCWMEEKCKANIS